MENKKSVINLKDVARTAGVSIGTVSNVINGLNSVKAANRQRVLDAMRKLDYIPNSMARSLKTRKSHLIGLILPSITNPFYPALSKGVEDVLQKRGYIVVQCNTERNPERERTYIETLLSNRVSGIIVVKSELGTELLRKYSRKSNIVLIDASPDYTGDLDMVETTNHDGIASSVKYLRDLGHMRIAYITGDLKAKSDCDRLGGFRDAMKETGVPGFEEYIRYGDFSQDAGFRLARGLLSLPDPPTAIACSNDLMAIGVLRAAKTAGIPVPLRLSVVGFDDIDMSALITPSLTTVVQPKYEQGEAAAVILDENIQAGLVGGGRRSVLPTRLIVRESASAPAREYPVHDSLRDESLI